MSENSADFIDNSLEFEEINYKIKSTEKELKQNLNTLDYLSTIENYIYKNSEKFNDSPKRIKDLLLVKGRLQTIIIEITNKLSSYKSLKEQYDLNKDSA